MATLNVGIKIGQSLNFTRASATGVVNSTLYTVPAGKMAIVIVNSFSSDANPQRYIWAGSAQATGQAGGVTCFTTANVMGRGQMTGSNTLAGSENGQDFKFLLTAGQSVGVRSQNTAAVWAYSISVLELENTI